MKYDWLVRFTVADCAEDAATDRGGSFREGGDRDEGDEAHEDQPE